MRIRAIPVILLLAATPAAADELVRLGTPELYELKVEGFELDRPAEVQVETVGIRERGGSGLWPWSWNRDKTDDNPFSVYAWIIDAESREPVWHMRIGETSRLSGKLREAKQTIRFEAGRYEVYLFSGYGQLARAEQGDDRDSGNWWEALFRDERHVDDVREDLESCHVTLSAAGLSRGDLRSFEPTGDLPDALVRLNRAGDSRYEARGFALESASRLRVYTVMEQDQDDDYPSDYGWIVDASTREVVWQPRDSTSRPAGGHRKNRMIDDEIELEAGRYLVYHGTDDSHSLEAFNVNPPYDPLNWGITLLPGKGFDPAGFATFDPAEPEALVDLGRAGDDNLSNQPFRLSRGGKLHLRALGEYISDSDEFVDGAWIVSAGSGRTLWEMTGGNTIGAGGASKNRMFDGLIELDAGDYVLYYSSDASHSYDGFNLAAPFEPEAWGAALRPGPGFAVHDFTKITETDVERQGNYLVRLVGMGDDEHAERNFDVEEAIEVAIYALGEGGSGSMHDYGYIVDTTHDRVVWTMDYDRTRHAGGASKNRVIDERIRLEPGSYQAVYVSDGSHSAASWNSDRPRDPMNWGITIRPTR